MGKASKHSLFCVGRLNILFSIDPIDLPISVDEGAILDVVFEKFHHTPPTGFERIMIEKALL